MRVWPGRARRRRRSTNESAAPESTRERCTGQPPIRDPLNRVKSMESSPDGARVGRAGHGGWRKWKWWAGIKDGRRVLWSYRPFSLHSMHQPLRIHTPPPFFILVSSIPFSFSIEHLTPRTLSHHSSSGSLSLFCSPSCSLSLSLRTPELEHIQYPVSFPLPPNSGFGWLFSGSSWSPSRFLTLSISIDSYR